MKATFRKHHFWDDQIYSITLELSISIASDFHLTGTELRKPNIRQPDKKAMMDTCFASDYPWHAYSSVPHEPIENASNTRAEWGRNDCVHVWISCKSARINYCVYEWCLRRRAWKRCSQSIRVRRMANRKKPMYRRCFVTN